MRLGFLVPGPISAISGGYGYDREILAGLRALGHAADVLELAGRHPLPDGTAAASADAAWRALAEDAVPVIDGLGLPAFLPLADALRARGAVALIHHPTSLETGHDAATAAALGEAERRMFPLFRRVIVTSPATAETLAADFGVARGTITVIVPGTPQASRCAGNGTPGCHVLAIGSLSPRKGHDILLHALARLPDLEWRLTVVGGPREGAIGRELADLAGALGVSPRVTFAGETTGAALEALWQQADVFALASHYEGYGMALAEAVRRGLPCVATDTGAASALVTPQSGVLVPPGDGANFSRGLRRLIFDRALRAAMAEAAWQHGRTLPDWPAQAEAFARALAA